MLVRQADSIREDVMEFNFNGKGAIFTKREFGFIIGLKMKNSVNVPPPPQSNRIRNTYFGHLKKIKNSNVRDVFLYSNFNKLEDKDDMIRLTLIYFLKYGLLDKESQVSIDIQYLSMVEDLEYFNEYAWGLESYNATISSMHRVWGYETIPLMRELYATKVNNSFPRICNWKATNLPVFKSVGKSLFDNVELYVIGRLRPINVEEESIYLTNEDYPTLAPIPPSKKHKRRRKEAINTENADFAYYQQQDASNLEGPSFENVGQQIGSSHKEYHRPNTYENMPMNEEGEIRDEETNVMQNDSEVRFISPSKVIQREPHIKKRAGKLKSPFVLSTETRETLNNILPLPMDFDPKRPFPDDI
ncbi:hypothetical protein FNV43_RR21507 [Rhamnella rubrinervis]|uniref:DUF1985 domain-containing protein n=1 Tax=Rhamnella rubrinervis TaxID=2594499 RepID=A0A8K0E0V2_9ROSA|nr:hypothetical protein FNV43_RR21507 [Rhamnella rubrinervis]